MVPSIAMSNNSIKRQSFVYTRLNGQRVQFQTIQFHMSFVCTQFKSKTVLFDPYIGPYQVIPLGNRVDLGAKIMKEYSALPTVSTLLKIHQQIV